MAVTFRTSALAEATTSTFRRFCAEHGLTVLSEAVGSLGGWEWAAVKENHVNQFIVVTIAPTADYPLENEEDDKSEYSVEVSAQITIADGRQVATSPVLQLVQAQNELISLIYGNTLYDGLVSALRYTGAKTQSNVRWATRRSSDVPLISQDLEDVPRSIQLEQNIVLPSESGRKPGARLQQRTKTMAGKFEVYQDAKSEYRWRLKAANGQTIATSGEGYTTKQNCLNGINSVKSNAPDAEVVEAT
jgi:uncharacterized protein